VQAELLDYQNTGKSILESSHRSPEFDAILSRAEERLQRLLGFSSDYKVLWLQGGASHQFAMVPLNLLPPDGCGGYVLTGVWSEKALAEAKRVGRATIVASSQGTRFDRIPSPNTWEDTRGMAYVHITSNNTIYGTQFPSLDIDVGAPLIADVSSDFLARPFSVDRFALLYAGAQKNLGPAGVTVVIARRDVLEPKRPDIPVILQYATHAKGGSVYNTPPVFAIYVSELVLEWLEQQGGLAALDKVNTAKAAAVYAAIDAYPHVYQGHAVPEARSKMNATWRLPSADAEEAFAKGAEERDLIGLLGHRSVGGMRASLYNAVSLESCELLASYMRAFAQSWQGPTFPLTQSSPA
jgi:phosphoserine aminotransferase